MTVTSNGIRLRVLFFVYFWFFYYYGPGYLLAISVEWMKPCAIMWSRSFEKACSRTKEQRVVRCTRQARIWAIQHIRPHPGNFICWQHSTSISPFNVPSDQLFVTNNKRQVKIDGKKHLVRGKMKIITRIHGEMLCFSVAITINFTGMSTITTTRYTHGLTTKAVYYIRYWHTVYGTMSQLMKLWTINKFHLLAWRGIRPIALTLPQSLTFHFLSPLFTACT